MNETCVERIADFSSQLQYDDLPENVIEEGKRLLLYSLGCALAGVEPKFYVMIETGKVII